MTVIIGLNNGWTPISRKNEDETGHTKGLPELCPLNSVGVTPVNYGEEIDRAEDGDVLFLRGLNSKFSKNPACHSPPYGSQKCKNVALILVW